MINKTLSFDLPIPWQNKKFVTQNIGSINFLVGPNGSVKSQFSRSLVSSLGAAARLLGTERLRGMEQMSQTNVFHDQFQGGLAKNQFQNYKNAGRVGSGIDTFVLLEERVDLRIQVEATLSHLFDRNISLEWDSGNLMAKAVLGEGGASYRLDRDECHGIKELLVLLTHLYNDEHPYLIIDEPELNLHPQYQAFLMQEVRKVAGDPDVDKTKKIVFLITHSPFILDFRSIEDVKSVVSFSLDHSVPRQIFSMDEEGSAELASLVPRLNVHHKQLFFSDNPIFVEGILDAQIVGTMQEARGVSVAGAGSCIIDAGGNEEVNKYLKLCLAFGKNAHFLYDLDSLFSGNLRSCLRGDDSVQSFLAAKGVGNEFARYCGELDKELTKLIGEFIKTTVVPTELSDLKMSLGVLKPGDSWTKENLAKARVLMLTAISRHEPGVESIAPEGSVAVIKGRLKMVVDVLREKNINLLPGGTLERYLPYYVGNYCAINDESKRSAVVAEMMEMAKITNETELSTRYGELYVAVCSLPGKSAVDVDNVLRKYLARYILDLQTAVTDRPEWNKEQLQIHLNNVQRATSKVFTIREFTRGSDNKFDATVAIAGMLGQGPRTVPVSHQTNAGMGSFVISPA